MNNKKKIYLALVFLLVFNSSAFAAGHTRNRAIKKINATISQMDLSRAVIHHSASADVSAKTIDTWHKARGFDGIGYHFVIRTDGSIEKGRNINKIGAHSKGRNNLVGICLTGNDKFTEAQKKSLISLLNQLRISNIERHHEECPGKGLNLDYIRANLVGVKVMIGKASFYKDTITATGERFNANELTCALKKGIKTYGKSYKVTNIDNGKSVIVRHNDCGTLKPGRVIDLTPEAFKRIGNINDGLLNVRVEVIK